MFSDNKKKHIFLSVPAIKQYMFLSQLEICYLNQSWLFMIDSWLPPLICMKSIFTFFHLIFSVFKAISFKKNLTSYKHSWRAAYWNLLFAQIFLKHKGERGRKRKKECLGCWAEAQSTMTTVKQINRTSVIDKTKRWCRIFRILFISKKVLVSYTAQVCLSSYCVTMFLFLPVI